MRILSALFVTVFLATCCLAQVEQTESKAVNQGLAPAQGTQKVPSVSTVQFLITAAATDFHNHGSSRILRFRDVHVGHLAGPDGKKHPMLCGQFIPAQDTGKSHWMPFVTIKTSGYEQWTGSQALRFCQDTSAVWDKFNDWSSSLQKQFDSLR